MANNKVAMKNAIELSATLSYMPSISVKIHREWEGGQEKEKIPAKSLDDSSQETNGRFVFLRHRIGRWVDSGYGYKWRLISIWLSSFENGYLDEIEKVIYHLPESFANSVREKTNKDEKFYTSTAAYGDFNVSAEVYLKNKRQPIIINRLINVHTGLVRSSEPLE